MCELAQHLVNQQEQQSGARRSHKDRQLGMLEAVGRVMEVSRAAVDWSVCRWMGWVICWSSSFCYREGHYDNVIPI